MELIIYVLKLLRRFPISTRVVPPLDDFCVLLKTSCSNLSHLLVLEDPLEYLLHNSTIFSKESFEISPFPNKFNIPRKSSLIPWSRIILITSNPILVFPSLCTLYRSLSTKYSKLYSSLCTILNNSSLLYLVLQYSWYFSRNTYFIWSHMVTISPPRLMVTIWSH